MSKFDFSSTINKIQGTLKKDERRMNQFGLGSSLEKVSDDPKDFVVLPEWWKEHTGILGLRFGNFFQIAGDPDSGKTSLSLLAIRCAQEQGYGVVYVETEGKTSEDDMLAAGINPKGVITVHTKITEEVYDNMGLAVDGFFADYPNEKLLVVIDSYGNTISMRDSSIQQVDSNAMVGGPAKMNRTGISGLAARQVSDPITVLVVNYTYDNMGSPGKTNAGGKALDFHCMLTLQSQRTGWYEKTVDGEKVRAGAFVKWRIYKNHFAKALKDADGKQILLPKEINLKISGDGLEPIKAKS